MKKQNFVLRNNINTLAHLSETKAALTKYVASQRLAFEELTNEREFLRCHLQNLTLGRMRIRQAIRELSASAGLLDKPLLIYDYDKTLERLNETKDIVARLRATLATIEQKINILERKLSNNNGAVTYSIR